MPAQIPSRAMTTATLSAKEKSKAPKSAVPLEDVRQALSTIAHAGSPLELDINLIDEDPDQPRSADNPGFAPGRLAELAESIKQRGVKTAISVRINQNQPGRYLINHGARRYRASKLAGKHTIPAYIDQDYTESDQVVENLHRHELTAREIAEYIGRELAKGKRQVDIAKQISKSKAFVSQHAALLDLPDPIAKAYSQGRAQDATVIYEMLLAFKKAPQQVEKWLADPDQEITRASVHEFREYLEHTQQEDQRAGVAEIQLPHIESTVKKPRDPQTASFKRVVLKVQHKNQRAQLLLTRKPPKVGYAWLQYESTGKELAVNLTQVQLLELAEG